MQHIAAPFYLQCFNQKHNRGRNEQMPLCYEQLNRMEREVIAINVRNGSSRRQIASLLGRSPSTISRELRRNRFPNIYRAQAAHEKAFNRRRIPRRARLLDCPCRQALVDRHLRGFWSPEQVAGRLIDLTSKSTIYRMIHTDRPRWLAYLRGPVKKKGASMNGFGIER